MVLHGAFVAPCPGLAVRAYRSTRLRLDSRALVWAVVLYTRCRKGGTPRDQNPRALKGVFLVLALKKKPCVTGPAQHALCGARLESVIAGNRLMLSWGRTRRSWMRVESPPASQWDEVESRNSTTSRAQVLELRTHEQVSRPFCLECLSATRRTQDSRTRVLRQHDECLTQATTTSSSRANGAKVFLVHSNKIATLSNERRSPRLYSICTV